MIEHPASQQIDPALQPSVAEAGLMATPAGGLAVRNSLIGADGSLKPGMRTLHYGQFEYQTNLPPEVDIFAEGHVEPSIVPIKADLLPVGTYTLSRPEETWGEFGDGKITVDKVQTIEVLETGEGEERGKAITVASFPEYRQDLWPSNPGTERIVEGLGFVIGDTGVSKFVKAIPTPETLVRKAKKLGVDVEVFPAAKKLDGRTYLGSYRARRYPISAGDPNEYKHDAQDDHVLGVILGGEPLRDALSDVASAALATNDQAIIDETSIGLDQYTATLRNVVSSAVPGAAYGVEKGRATYLDRAKEIGMSRETAEKVLAHAQDSAASFGLSVTKLH